MMELQGYRFEMLDYIVFGGYIVLLSAIGFWVGRKEKVNSEDYFLAGRTLPWYVVGGSFVASNISSEHFIGMVGAAYIYGICVAMSEWRNVWTFSIMVWFFIPFLIASRAFTIPEFLEKRFNGTIRQYFAIITIITNILAFLAAVIYGGGLALHVMFGWGLNFSIVILAVVAGSWAIYGGLRSVAWTDFFTVIVMIFGGILVTFLGLKMLSGDQDSVIVGFKVMIEANKAQSGAWAQAVSEHVNQMISCNGDSYNRLSVIQPITHRTHPWPFLIFGFLSVSIWYNVINQFMIQRVLGAKNMYHARMGIVFAGFMKIFLPVFIVLPGLILFTKFPEVIRDSSWSQVQEEANKGYVNLVQMLVPLGLRGLLLAALFGAIQSTINSVLNSTATIFTWDIWKRWLRPNTTEKGLVWVGIFSSVIILAIAIVLAIFVVGLKQNLFVFIQSLYAFFAPPFSAVFLLGIMFRRINAKGATVAVFLGFVFGIGMKLFLKYTGGYPLWLRPYEMQSITNWTFCILVCTIVSLCTVPPKPEKVSDDLTFNFRNLNVFQGLGSNWYSSVTLWWGLFFILVLTLIIIFSGKIL